jgi:hypothetical protein
MELYPPCVLLHKGFRKKLLRSNVALQFSAMGHGM